MEEQRSRRGTPELSAVVVKALAAALCPNLNKCALFIPSCPSLGSRNINGNPARKKEVGFVVFFLLYSKIINSNFKNEKTYCEIKKSTNIIRICLICGYTFNALDVPQSQGGHRSI